MNRPTIAGALVAVLAVACSPGPGSVTSPSTGSPADASASIASASTAAGSPVGIPILSVSEARAAIAATTAARSIAVRGWYGEIALPSCGPYAGVIDRLQRQCPPILAALMEGPEQLTTVSATGGSGHEPTGPWLEVRFLPGVPWPANSVDAGAEMGAPPLAVVLLGHARDPRSVFCEAAARDACRGLLVVDQVLAGDGRLVTPVPVRFTEKAGRQSPADVMAAATAAHPGWTATSVVFVGDGGDQSDPLASDVDPRLALAAWPGTTDRGWLVRLVHLGTDEAPRTVFVDDANAAVRELPPWPTWDATPASGLAGADPVPTATPAATAGCAAGGGTFTGGIFVRMAAGGPSLRLASYGMSRPVLADPARPLFVRGTGGDTVLLDAQGAVLAQGVVQVIVCPTGDAPGSPVVFQRVGLPGG